MTAFLASIGKPREAVRAAMVHILFNSAGVLIWIGLIPYLADFVRMISPTAEGLEGIARLKAETPRQIANSHTAFNVTNTLMFIGFTPLIARAVEFLVPDRKISEPVLTRRRALEDILIHTPGLALEVSRSEVARLGAVAVEMLRKAFDPVTRGSESQLRELREMDNEVDELHAELITYLSRLSRQSLSEAQSERLSEYITVANNFESIGDLIETNMVDAGLKRLKDEHTVSDSTLEALRDLHEKVTECAAQSLEAFAANDRAAALAVIDSKAQIGQLGQQAESHLTRRLAADEPRRLEAFRLESEIVESLKRAYYFAKRISKWVTTDESEGAAPEEAPPGKEIVRV